MYALYYDVPGDEHIFVRVKSEIGDDAPDGLIVQIVSHNPSGGLRHLSVWESAAQWERFQNDRVGPAVARVLAAMGIADAPRPELHELELVDVDVASGRVGNSAR